MDWKTFDFKNQKVGPRGEILNKSVYKCGFCGGKRFAPSKRNIMCPVCLGDGVIKIKPPVVVCAYCGGSGNSGVNADLPCSVCSGKGVVGVQTDCINICPACKGKGIEKGSGLPCLRCRGKGVVTGIKRLQDI